MSQPTASVIGQGVRRREDARFLVGRGRYVTDLPFESALDVAIVRSPHAHARIVGVDAQAARAVVRDLGEPGLDATRYHSPDRVTWASGVHVATVEIDGETGAVTLLSYHAVHDAGHEINPLVVAGQTQGGAVQGIGMALTEEIVYDESGQVLTGTLMDYGLARAESVPGIEVTNVDSPSPLNPLGVKGTGEGSAVPGAAAITNAVADALGSGGDLTQVPLRREAVLNALRQRGADCRRTAG